jgi:hypothetical protein
LLGRIVLLGPVVLLGAIAEDGANAEDGAGAVPVLIFLALRKDSNASLETPVPGSSTPDPWVGCKTRTRARQKARRRDRFSFKPTNLAVTYSSLKCAR